MENVCVDKLLGYKKDGVHHSFLEAFAEDAPQEEQNN